MIPAFKSAAEDLLNTSGLSAVDLLAKALAKAAVSLSPSVKISSCFYSSILVILIFLNAKHGSYYE